MEYPELEEEYGTVEKTLNTMHTENGGTHVVTEEDVELLIFENHEDAVAAAKEYVKMSFEESGVEGFADWVIADNITVPNPEKIAEEEARFIDSDPEINRDYQEVKEEWMKGLENPIKFLVEEKVIYTKDELIEQDWIEVDVDSLAETVVREDGVAHFLNVYDGAEENFDGNYVYRTN